MSQMNQVATELAKNLFDGLRALKETAVAVAPGLKDLGADLKHEGKQQLAAGAHELAAALFNGNAFVMYPRTGKNDPGKDDPSQSQGGHGVHGPENSPTQGQGGMQQESPTQQHERGGRSM
jgi:hypothetical protein